LGVRTLFQPLLSEIGDAERPRTTVQNDFTARLDVGDGEEILTCKTGQTSSNENTTQMLRVLLGYIFTLKPGLLRNSIPLQVER
jgi:hypothetical protein